MTKRRILAMIIALIMCVSLSACSKEESGAEDVQVENEIQNESVVETKSGNYVRSHGQAQAGRFILIYSGTMVCESCMENGIDNSDCELYCNHSNPQQYIMYNSENMIMYTYIEGYRSGGLVMMVNPDGTPQLYSPNDEIK